MGYNHYVKYADGRLVQWGLVNVAYTQGFGTIEFPIQFAGKTIDYYLFAQASYSGGGVLSISTAQKPGTDKGFVYSRTVDGSKIETHNEDWLAIGRWK